MRRDEGPGNQAEPSPPSLPHPSSLTPSHTCIRARIHRTVDPAGICARARGVPVSHFRHPLLVFALAGLLSLPARAAFDPEAGLPLIRNYPPEVYKAHDQIFASAEGRDGVVYFGTYATVVSFDGERWRSYPLPGTWVRALCVGDDGLVYVGGGGLLGRLEPEPGTGVLRYVSLRPHLPPEWRDIGSVWSGVPIPRGMVFATDGAVFTWHEGRFHVEPHPGMRPTLRTAQGRVFCHVGDELRERTADGWHVLARHERLRGVRRLTLLDATGAEVTVARDDGGLLRIQPDGTVREWTPAAAGFLRDAGIRNGVRLPDGGYAISTAARGLLLTDADGTPERLLDADRGLAATSTYGMLLARDRTLWVETANGLSHFGVSTPWTIFDERNGLPRTIAGSPVRVGGRLMTGLTDLPPRRLQPARDGYDLARLVDLAPEVKGRLANLIEVGGVLYSGGERGLVRISEPSREVHATSSPVEHVIALQAAPGTLVAGLTRGIEILRFSDGDSVAQAERVSGIDVEISNLVELPGGVVWAGTTAGVAWRLTIDPAGRVRDATVFDGARGLSGEAGWVRVSAFQGAVLVATPRGFFQLSADGERFVAHPGLTKWKPAGVNTLPFDCSDGNRIYAQIAGAGGGYVLGRIEVKPEGSTWTSLPTEIQDVLGHGGARVLTWMREQEREWLFIAGTRGIVRFDLGSAPASAPPPAVLVNEIVRGDWRRAGTATPLHFDFSRESLTFRFAAAGAALRTLGYETRLLGYNDRWTPASTAEVSFTGLVGGPYTLQVRARDREDRVGPPAEVTFSIAAPWWRSPLMLAGYAAAGLVSLGGFVRWRLRAGERERQRLERTVAERTRDLAAARDQAEAASRAKSAFLASMSHELRTPLNGVIGYAQLLQTDARLTGDQLERIRIVHTSGEHLLRMINDVLDLAKIEAGKLELRLAPGALRDILQDVASAHRPAAAQKGLELMVETEPAVPEWVELDAAKVRQVLDNLLGNAIKFTSRGRVTLRAGVRRGPEGVRLVIAVQDTGPGIAAPDRDRLFQPFEQAHLTRPAAPGTGLGLAISRALVERMGGAFEVESAAGAGSVFAFHVPLVEVAANQAAKPVRRVGFEGGQRRVLIVDDHAVNRSLLIDLLRPLGFVCTAYESGPAALAALHSGAEPWPHAAILDLRMQPMDGLELTRQLRGRADGRPLGVLLTSASVLTFDPAEGRAAGCDDFLPKPFRTEDLLEKLGALLGLRWRTEGTPRATGPAFAVVTDAALPGPVAASLRELLATGDLAEFRAAVARFEVEHPAAAGTLRQLDAAAAEFQLSRLRSLLSCP